MTGLNSRNVKAVNAEYPVVGEALLSLDLSVRSSV